MSSEDKGLHSADNVRDKEDVLIRALIAFDSNLGQHLGTEMRWTRFFKVVRRPDGSWLAILGSRHQGQQEIVFFGNGGDFYAAVRNLGRAIAADAWREDRYANEE